MTVLTSEAPIEAFEFYGENPRSAQTKGSFLFGLTIRGADGFRMRLEEDETEVV